MTSTDMTRTEVFEYIAASMTEPVTSRAGRIAAVMAVNSMLTRCARTGDSMTVESARTGKAVVTGRKVRTGFLRSEERFTITQVR